MNNINLDPLFESDWSLSEDSPCIDAGIDVGLVYAGDAPDIGAFEYGLLSSSNTYRQDYDLNLYPNPALATEDIFIDLSMPQYIGDVQLRLFDIDARLVYADRIAIHSANSRIKLPALNHSGSYQMVLITDNQEIISRRIIVAK